MKNWIATYYDKDNNIIGVETFEDRTDHEAENEAMGLIPDNCEDWTLVPKKDSERDKLIDRIISHCYNGKNMRAYLETLSNEKLKDMWDEWENSQY